jgi:hypothetical protein
MSAVEMRNEGADARRFFEVTDTLILIDKENA